MWYTVSMKLTFIKPRGARYFYKVADVKHKKPYTRKNCTTCGVSKMMQARSTAEFCSKACSKAGELNHQWKGDDAQYLSLHQRVYRERGTAKSCVWGCLNAAAYDWANLTGDYTDVQDYASMCRQCHASYDGAIGKCFDKTCSRGHTLNNSTMYVKFYGTKEVRQCKQCAKDRANRARMTNKSVGS